jgi:glycosyltransferase involved in cell wall biosynthesis
MNKICIINPNYYKSSGVTKVIETLYNTFSSNDSNLNFYFIDCQYGDKEMDHNWKKDKDISVFKFMSLNPFILVKELIRFKKFIRANNIQLIHLHHRRHTVLFSLCKFYHKVPLLYTSHLTYKYNLLYKLLTHLPCVAISESVQNNLIETVSSKDITLLGNPVPFPTSSFSANSYDSNTAITVGRLSDVKGLSFIIKAFTLLHAKGLKKKLLIIGEGEEECMLKRQVLNAGLEDFITFVGYSTRVNDYYDQGAFTISHSRVEGMPLVIIESAARSKPSLVTDVDGSRDTVPYSIELPNLIEYSNVKMLAETLEFWFENPSLIKQDGINFNKFLKIKCSAPKVADGYYKKYMELINGSG